MTKDQTISRGAVMEAVRTLGLEPQEVTMLVINSEEVDVFYTRSVEEREGKPMKRIKVV